MEFRKTLSEILEKEIRVKYKSIRQFANVANMPYMTVSGVIKRGVENTTVGTLQKICDTLNITISDLYHMQALDTIQAKLQNNEYTDDELISDLQESRLLKKTNLSKAEKQAVISNYRFVFSNDWI